MYKYITSEITSQIPVIPYVYAITYNTNTILTGTMPDLDWKSIESLDIDNLADDESKADNLYEALGDVGII